MGMESKEKTTFDTIYNANVEIVYKVALKYAQNHHIAEEIAQSVFMKFFMKMDNANLERAREWLILNAKCMSLNYQRDGKREILVEDAEAFWEEESVDELESCVEDAFMEEMRDCEIKDFSKDILNALYLKNPRWFEAIMDAYVLEKPQKEMAESMGVSLEGVHSLLYRAKRWLKENYGRQYDHLRKS